MGLRRFAEVFENCRNVGHPKEIGESIDYPINAGVEIERRDELKQLAKKRIGLRNLCRRFLTRKCLKVVIVKPCCKHSVRDRLGVNVGE